MRQYFILIFERASHKTCIVKHIDELIFLCIIILQPNISRTVLGSIFTGIYFGASMHFRDSLDGCSAST